MKRVRQARRILHLYSSSTARDFHACYVEIKQQDILTSSTKLCSVEFFHFKDTEVFNGINEPQGTHSGAYTPFSSQKRKETMHKYIVSAIRMCLPGIKDMNIQILSLPP